MRKLLIRAALVAGLIGAPATAVAATQAPAGACVRDARTSCVSGHWVYFCSYVYHQKRCTWIWVSG